MVGDMPVSYCEHLFNIQFWGLKMSLSCIPLPYKNMSSKHVLLIKRLDILL